MSQISRLRDAEISNGNLINADDIDAELNQLVNESNSQDTRLTSLETGTMTITGSKTFASPVKTDQIDERSAGAGVTVDGVLLKDGAIRIPGAAGYTPVANGDLGYDATLHAYRVMVEGTGRSLLHSGQLPSLLVGPPPRYGSASTVVIPAGLIALATDGVTTLHVTTDLTVDLSISGAGGLDAGAGTEAANTWYYLYLIKNSATGTVSAVFSAANEAGGGAITLPSGYDKKRQLPLAVRNNASSNILPFQVAEGWPHRPRIAYSTQMFRYVTTTVGATNILNAGTATSFTAVSAASYVPPISRRAAFIVNANSNTTYGRIRTDASLGNDTNFSNIANTVYDLPVTASQGIEYIRDNGTNIYIDVHSFVVTEVN